ncbi:MAG: ABC transporter substrate-binding protein [Pseudomonadota bacterium]
MTRWFVRGVATALMCLFATSSMADEALKKVNIGVDWFVNPDHGPVIVALERGYFTDAGLDVTIVTPTDTMDNVTMVLDGRAVIGMSDQPRTQIEIAGGSPLAVVGTLIPVPLNVVLVLEDGDVQSIADLAGKKVGYADSEKVERALFELSLAAHGITMDDITLVDVGFTMVPALLDGKVDALTDVYRNFEPYQVDMAGKSPRVFDIENQAIPPYSELLYIVDRNNADADVVAKFLTAVERGARAIADDPEAAWLDFIKYDGKLDNTLNYKSWHATAPFFALRPGLVDRARFESFASFLSDHKLISSLPSADAYFLDP